MRVLHVIQRYWPCIGGAERYLQEVSERLVREGHKVTVHTTDARDLGYFWNADKAAMPIGEEVHIGVRICRFAERRWGSRARGATRLASTRSIKWPTLTE